MTLDELRNLIQVGTVITVSGAGVPPAYADTPFHVDAIDAAGAVSFTPIAADVVPDVVPDASSVDIVQLLTDASSLPEADDLSPGRLGQLISAVAFAYAGRPIRNGQKTVEARIADLQEVVAASKA